MRASHPEPMRRSQRWIHCWIGSALFLKACHGCHADLSLREALPQSYPHTYQNNPRKFRPYSTDLDTHTQGCTPDHPPHIRRGEESIYLCLRTCLSAPLICLKSETHVQTLLASRDFLHL